jgi:hypothetical protein
VSAASTALPELASGFTPVAPLREAGDAMARTGVLAPADGAGTLAWVRSAARIEAALAPEPEQPGRFAAASAQALARRGPASGEKA